jgi:hypothetical protein
MDRSGCFVRLIGLRRRSVVRGVTCIRVDASVAVTCHSEKELRHSARQPHTSPDPEEQVHSLGNPSSGCQAVRSLFRIS